MKADFSELDSVRVNAEPGTAMAAINSEPGDRFGAFALRSQKGVLSCLVETAQGWEHVSATGQRQVKQGKHKRTLDYTPSWDEMVAVKDLFFEADETVFQFHPAKELKAGAHDDTLHLWRPADGREIPLPPQNLVTYEEPFWKPVDADAQGGDEPGNEEPGENVVEFKPEGGGA